MRKHFAPLFILLIIFTSCNDQKVAENASPNDLPRSTPEAEGISSLAISTLIDSMNLSNLGFHSIMIIRHGQVVAEGWWNPYREELKHSLYSLSKSFTSTAIGFAVQEGLLTVNDPVISFFPNDLPAEVSDRLASMTINNLLTMNTGHSEGTLNTMRNDSTGNWPKAFLAQPLTHEPGTHFFYNTGATYMLSNIIQQKTGLTVQAYLTPRLFEPLGITGMDWELDPKGVNVGGYGLRVKTEDIAKLGLLYLNKGEWKGEQLLSADWVEEATSKQVTSQEGDNDWSQGYGYQFWRCKPAGLYRGDGAFGQYCIVMPEQDAVVAITSETFDMQACMTLIWKYLLPEMKPDELDEDPEAWNALQSKMKALSLPVPAYATSSPMTSLLQGKVIALEPNEFDIESLAFTFGVNDVSMDIYRPYGQSTMILGVNEWRSSALDRYNLFERPDQQPIRSVTAGTLGWKDSKTMVINVRYLEMANGDEITLSFDEGGKVTLSFLGSVAAGRQDSSENRTPITGVIQQQQETL
ncbi:serine hydrolase domain-containing protein [Marinoscillum luteum]|uniref:Serine hydrolase domain-containing protein n=1 Tax=Marinoscillum luteum TaxID=861051 RepID=A0ABW7N5I2_9BACT